MSIEYETWLCGGLALEPSRITDVESLDEISDFTDPFCRDVYSVIRIEHFKGTPVWDPCVLLAELRKRHSSYTAADLARLAQIPTAAHTRYYASLVVDARARALLAELKVDEQCDPRRSIEDTRDRLQKVEERLDRLNEKLETRTLREIAIEEDQATHETGIAAATPELTKELDGVKPGTLFVVGARPSNGKTLFCLQSAYQVARTGHVVAVLSLEMPAGQVGQRVLASASRAPDAITKFFETQSPIFFRECDPSVDAIVGEIGRYKREYFTEVIVIDFLQLIDSKQTRSRYEQITDVSVKLKRAAVENNVVIYLASQLSRETEKRSPAIPRKSDLRDSGGIEQDADYIVLLYWPGRDTTLKLDARTRHGDSYFVYVEKNRFGSVPASPLHMTIDAQRQTLSDEKGEPF